MHHLVPAQWGGSVEHYYHFLLGYLFPATLWVADHPQSQPVVRDCGPMNPWFDVISTNFKVIPAGVMLHQFARGAPATVLPAGDDPEAFDARELARFRVEVLARAGVGAGENDAQEAVFIQRGRSHPYYAQAASEQRTSGAFRRSIPNSAELLDGLASRRPTRLVDAAELTPAEQIRLHASTDLLIGQHGAGLANMIWMPPGSTVVEILPPMPAHLRVIFRNLAAALGHRYSVIDQRDAHAPIAVDELTAVVAAAFGEPVRTGAPAPGGRAGDLRLP